MDIQKIIEECEIELDFTFADDVRKGLFAYFTFLLEWNQKMVLI